MKQGASNRRVNEQAREVIASILLFEISDPRLRMVTITGCEVSYDRSACNVFFSTEPERYEEVTVAFAKAAGRIRSLMAKKLSWRVAPELRFKLDKSVDMAQSIATALVLDRDRNLESAAIAAERAAAEALEAERAAAEAECAEGEEGCAFGSCDGGVANSEGC